jgi:hypothetical protein
MSLIADAFQPFFVNGILSITRGIGLPSIPDSILSPRAAYDLDFDKAHRRVLFDFRAPDFLATAVASDCCRFSGSAFQTVSSISRVTFEKNTMPWELVKLYYAAFYSGHTIIRLLGESCSFFDRRHIERIDEFAQAIGKAPGFLIDAGSYRCTVDASATKVTCTKNNRGTHEAFWGIFGDRIEAATENVLLGPLVPVDAQSVFHQLEAFKRLMRRNGSYRWLSTLRNDCQYRHHHDVWFPSSIRKRERDMLSRLAAQWRADPMTVDLDTARFGLLGEFTIACAFIISLCRSLIRRIVERCPRGRSFLNYGPMAFIE